MWTHDLEERLKQAVPADMVEGLCVVSMKAIKRGCLYFLHLS